MESKRFFHEGTKKVFRDFLYGEESAPTYLDCPPFLFPLVLG